MCYAARMTRRALERELVSLADPLRASHSLRFFKTGKGEYGEGDRFLGITVPVLRKTALRYRTLDLDDIGRLLASPLHEYRLAALEILVWQYEKAGEECRERIVEFYLAHTAGVNNWDLVDASAPYIVGGHVKTHPREVLYRLAESPMLWERRMAMVSTWALIRAGETEDALRIAEMLIADGHDLIQKAVGWMLREVGRVSRPALLRFLERHYKGMPRTALRYAIEHLPPERRKRILAGEFA